VLTPRNLSSWCLVVVGLIQVFSSHAKGLANLELVDNFRYLGVIFSRSFSFNLCVDTLTKVDRKQ